MWTKKSVIDVSKFQTYPAAPFSPLKGVKQYLVRVDDSFPCLVFLSFHEKLDTSTAFLIP
jgi:hypothetical protein